MRRDIDWVACWSFMRRLYSQKREVGCVMREVRLDLTSCVVAQGAAAMTSATVAVSFFAYGTWRNSFGPCAFDFGPSTPHTMNCDFGKPACSTFINGIVPPCPIYAQLAP